MEDVSFVHVAEVRERGGQEGSADRGGEREHGRGADVE